MSQDHFYITTPIFYVNDVPGDTLDGHLLGVKLRLERRMSCCVSVDDCVGILPFPRSAVCLSIVNSCFCACNVKLATIINGFFTDHYKQEKLPDP